MRRRLVAGNWKMHGSAASNRALLEALLGGSTDIAGVDCVVCAPYPYLDQVCRQLAGSSIAPGAQNLSEHASGAYTGEVSAAMLAELGCRFVIAGHSERRALFGESDVQVAAKVTAALKAGLVPILCVGESLEERESGRTESTVARQLDAVIDAAGVGILRTAILAYEPVWAIGTGRTATPGQAQDVHEFLRRRISAVDAAVAPEACIVYGGSVKASNAAAIFAQPDVDGGLIGGASLVAEEFLAILRAARRS